MSSFVYVEVIIIIIIVVVVAVVIIILFVNFLVSEIKKEEKQLIQFHTLFVTDKNRI